MIKEEKIILLREMRYIMSQLRRKGLCRAYAIACMRLNIPCRDMISDIPELSFYQPDSLEWRPFWFDPLDVATRLRIIDTVIQIIDNQF